MLAGDVGDGRGGRVGAAAAVYRGLPGRSAHQQGPRDLMDVCALMIAD